MDWREVKALADDDVRVRNLAKVLLETPGLTEKQHDFLSDMAKFKGSISPRQGETLLGIRDDFQQVSTIYGFDVGSLIRRCWLGRADLEDEDEEWIEKLAGKTKIRWKNCGRLLRCARRLELID